MPFAACRIFCGSVLDAFSTMPLGLLCYAIGRVHSAQMLDLHNIDPLTFNSQWRFLRFGHGLISCSDGSGGSSSSSSSGGGGGGGGGGCCALTLSSRPLAIRITCICMQREVV